VNETLGDPSLPRGTVTAFSIENDQALAALVNLIVVLADNDYFLGLRISEWAVGAPQLEMGVACAAIAQDKLGHSRALYPLLEDLPWPGAPAPLQRERDRERHYSVSYLDVPFPSWANVAAALALIGPALGTMFEALAAGRYEALARRVRRILGEEELTVQYVEGVVRDLAASPRGLALLQEQLSPLLTEMLCWFGPIGEPGVEALKAEGLLARDNEELRQAYLGRVMPLLNEIGVQVPVRQAADGLSGSDWEYGELPWSDWNRLQRRLEPRRR
jgi:1,2-phenylacetyl-CoA epoxidase catalytic subunit